MKLIYHRIYRALSLGVLFTASMLLGGCSELKFGNDFLDQEPDQIGIDIDQVFSKKHYAMQVLTHAYTSLPYGVPCSWDAKLGGDMLEALTDLSYASGTYGGATQLYYTGAYSPATESSKSKYLFNNHKVWDGIRYAWLMIENTDRVPDMSTEEKERRKAEAKLIIATHYCDLLRHFGGFPFLDHAISVNETHIFPRLTAEESVNRLVALIDEAIDSPLSWTVADNDNGRMTKAYAMALKLRVLLFAASPLFNSAEPYMPGEASDLKLTWFGGEDPQWWKRACDAGHEFMEALAANGGYGLVKAGTPDSKGYREAFRTAYFTRANSEVLLSVRRSFRNNYAKFFCGDPDNFAFKQCPTLAYMQLFPMEDGSDFVVSDWDNPQEDPFAHRDPRFYETILTNGRPYKNRLSQLYIGGADRPNAQFAGTGLLLYKFSQDYTPSTSVGAIDSWPAMRLSEVLLSYAEALNEHHGAPTSEAYTLVNQVRARVGLGRLTEGMTREQFRAAVLRERACEFGYEDVRWYDLVRWKMADRFQTPIEGINMFKDSSKTHGYRYEIFSVTPARAWQQAWSPKWYLSAFPINEIDKDYGLVQNPGW